MKKKMSVLLIPLVLTAMILAVIVPVGASSGAQKFIVSVDNIANFKFTDSGAFNTPVGQTNPGPLLPGSSYRWSFYGNQGEYVNFATMFVQSNDWFFAPDERGIPLYNADGSPHTGDVTAYVKLWDAGTEVDQAVGEGADQAPRQAGPNSGAADPNNNVRQVLSGALPAVADLVQVRLDGGGNGRFTLTITNISGNSSTATPLAPGVGVVHAAPAPLFINGQAASNGLEALAEDGNAAILAGQLAAYTGINTPLAPVAWVVTEESGTLFTSGSRASAGLEALAEDGGPGALVASLAGYNAGAAAVGRGASGPGPIFAPTGNYSFEITAAPGERLSLATMFVQSNDWFFGLNSLPLFDNNGDPIVGNITNHLTLYDAGTEVDQTPGFGSNQAPRQAGPNTGTSEGGVVSLVTDAGFNNPAGIIHVTITPVQ